MYLKFQDISSTAIFYYPWNKKREIIPLYRVWSWTRPAPLQRILRQRSYHLFTQLPRTVPVGPGVDLAHPGCGWRALAGGGGSVLWCRLMMYWGSKRLMGMAGCDTKLRLPVLHLPAFFGLTEMLSTYNRKKGVLVFLIIHYRIFLQLEEKRSMLEPLWHFCCCNH